METEFDKNNSLLNFLNLLFQGVCSGKLLPPRHKGGISRELRILPDILRQGDSVGLLDLVFRKLIFCLFYLAVFLMGLQGTLVSSVTVPKLAFLQQ